MKYLIENKAANIKSKNEFLLIASKEGHLEVVKLLIEKGIDINQIDIFRHNALHWASNVEVVKLLIEKGIDINQTDKNGWNALHWASKRGHKEIEQILIDKGLKK